MRLRDYKIGWRMLAKEPTYSSVVIAGLGGGLCRLFSGAERYCCFP